MKLTMYAATGNLGYGFPEEALCIALEHDPAFLGSDAGSCDPGPCCLGTGKAFVSRGAAKRDLKLLVKAGAQKGIPVIIGSAGGSGSDCAVDSVIEILKEILREEGLHKKVAKIYSEQSHAYLKNKLSEGKIISLSGASPLTEETINRTIHTVAAMGPEPIQEALQQGAEIVIAGRATDASIYAAVPLMLGCDPGLVWHAAKIIECGAAMAVPKSSDSMMAHIYDDYFILEPPNPAKRVKAANVAAHTMYECPHPYLVHEPNGIIDAGSCKFEQINDRCVKVSGSQLREAPYSVKLEGVERLGFRTIAVGGTHDPALIEYLDQQIENVKNLLTQRVKNVYPELMDGGYQIKFVCYGKNGVMGKNETDLQTGKEIGIVIDVISDTQEHADSILSMARTLLMHSDYPNRKCIAGSIAWLFSPSDISVGEVFKFNMNHSLLLENPLEPFRIVLEDM